MTNYSSGHKAEKVAAEYLRGRHYEVLEINWRHPRAEIDIIARQKLGWRRYGPLVFFEVKHRKTDKHGRGLDYITPKKLLQMQFAADVYVTTMQYSGDFVLGAVELEGDNYKVTNVVEVII